MGDITDEGRHVIYVFQVSVCWYVPHGSLSEIRGLVKHLIF